jgi:hypothetical protein
MNENIPTIIDIFYSVNINSTAEYKTDKFIDLYDTVKILPIDKKGDQGFVSKKYSQTTFLDSDRKVDLFYFDPPVGPLPPGSQCSFSECSRIGPLNKSRKVYHRKDCRTPNKESLIISNDGLIEYKEKIEKILKEKLQGKKVSKNAIDPYLSGEKPIGYLYIFPNRGLKSEGKNISDDRKISFGNTIILSYKTTAINPSKYFSREHLEGYNISIRINKNLSVYAFSVPYELKSTNFETFPKTVMNYVLNNAPNVNSTKYSDKIIKNKVIDSLTWISVLKGNYNVLKNKDYILNLDELDRIINTSLIIQKKKEHLQIGNESFALFNYKSFSDLSLINFYLAVDGISAYIEIRIRGSVRILISYGSKYQKMYGVKWYDSVKTNENVTKLTKSVLQKIGNFLHPLFIINQKVLLLKFERATQFDKIYNIYTPPSYAGKGIIQPQMCNGKNKTRPYPYSFKGPCPSYYEVVGSEGNNYNKSTGKLKAFDLYEPCCRKLTGTYPDELFFDDFKHNDEDEIDRKIDRIGKKNGNVDTFIKETKGDKKIFLRRLIYGFPNNLKNELSSSKFRDLFEDGRKTLDSKLSNYNKYKIRDIDSHKPYGIDIIDNKYVDSKTSTYVPGTQDKKKYGDGTKIKDTRVYSGLKQLLEYNKDFVIENLVSCYFRDYKINIPLETDSKNDIKKFSSFPTPQKIKVLTHCDKNILNDSEIMTSISKHSLYVKLFITKNSFYILENSDKENIILSESFDFSNDFNGLYMTGFWENGTFYPIDCISAPEEKEVYKMTYLVTENKLKSDRESFVIKYTQSLQEAFEQFFSTEPVMFNEYKKEKIKKLQKGNFALFMPSTKKYESNLFKWYEDIDQYYIDKLIFNFKIPKCADGSCYISSGGSKIKYLPETLKLGKNKANKIVPGSFIEFIVNFDMDSRGIKKINSTNPFEIISKLKKVKNKYKYSSVRNPDSSEETLYKVCMVFKPFKLSHF